MNPQYDFGVEGPVQAEIFVLYLQDGEIRVTGPCGAEPWYVELGDVDDPVDTVTRLVRSNIGDPVVVHSTSWRRTRDAVILSFVVVIEPGLVGTMESSPVARTELARSDATVAPAAVAAAQVVEHGLRHLAWLVKDDPVVCAELAGEWTTILADYEPQPFRNLR